MRVLIWAIAAITVLVTPALAQQTLAEQVAAARQMFMAGLGADAFREGGYYAQLVDGLDGSYIELSAMIDTADAAGIRRHQDAFCAQKPFVVTATPPFGIFITRGADEKIQYTYTGGATFIPALDVIGYARGNPSARGSAATDLLKRVSEPVSIWRPSRDVFVITGRDVPDVFVRCPKSAALPAPLDLNLPPISGGDMQAPMTPAPADAAPTELEAALGMVFDQQFGDGKPVGRATFIACAAPVFASLSAEDLAAVIASNFVPSQELRERLEAENPDLSAALGACAETAQAATE